MAICPCHNDKKASLSISYDSRNDKTLIYCHAGCDTSEILSRVGLKMRDLYGDGSKKKSDREGRDSGRNIAAVYKYTDSKGNLLFEKVRFHPKNFSQRRYIDGVVVWGLGEGRYYETYPGSKEYSMKSRRGADFRDFPETKPVLYNLPSVIEAVKKGETVYIVEGEKDADNLIKLGLTATTNFDGASKSLDKQKWRDEYNEYLKGGHLVLLPDNDNPGRAHMLGICEKLKGMVKSIKIVELPVPSKEDVSCYLDEGHTLEELLNLVENTVHICESLKARAPSLLGYNFSDVGNAERLIALYGSDIRYCCGQNKFYIWSGKHWQTDGTGAIYKLAKSTLRRFMAEGEAMDDRENPAAADVKKKITGFVIKSESDTRIKAMVNQAKSQPEVIMTRWDEDPYLINLRNGTLDLRCGSLVEHKKSNYITRLIELDYDEKASCPNWIDFLHKIFEGDDRTIEFVQKSIGYSLTGSQKEQCFYILYGSGANGKTTFLNAIRAILGEYGDTLKSSSLMARQFDDGARGDLAKLRGKRFVTASELNEGQYFDESLLKSLTGGESISVRFLYGEEFELKPEFKIWIGTNEKPKVRGSDLGIWRRVRMIPFLHTFSGNERDKNYFEKYLVPELPGILNWAVEGSIKWQREGVDVPKNALAAAEEYKNEMDIVGRFIEECCVIGEDFLVKTGEIYDRYVSWCSNVRENALSATKFGRKMSEKGYDRSKSNGLRYYKGLGLLGYR